jgi:flagella basal body P-ring formation protein FlgA
MLRAAAVLTLLLGAAPVRAAEAELAVPTRTIYPGEAINSTILGMRPFDLRDGQSVGFVRLPETLEGKVARRTLLANQPIPVQAVEEPRLALVGRQVRVEYREGGLVISTFGSVLQAGGLGDVISVRILDGGRTIFGTVQKDGSVRVGEGGAS